MKNINDRPLYFYFSVITLAIALVCGLIAYHSMLSVEPRVEKLIAERENITENYTKAYRILRNPQVFARYENFDAVAQPVKMILKDFDRRAYNREPFTAEDRIYLEILLERRALGSRLSRNTMVFFLLLSALGWGFYFYERKTAK
jgi:hypothetical protein